MGDRRIGERVIRLHGRDDVDERLVLTAAGQVLAAGLVRADSAFTPGRPVWSMPSASELVRALDHVLAEGPADYQSRLLDELRGASDPCIQLAAELQYLMHLPAKDIRPETKRERVAALLGLLPGKVVVPAELAAAAEAGVFNVGMGFKMQGWRQLKTLYALVESWTRAGEVIRDDASTDPRAFKRFLDHTGGAAAIRNMLMYLAFPDAFEPIISQKHKTDIRAAFASYVDVPDGDVDQDLLAIRKKLEAEAGRPIDFYADDLMPRWRAGGGPAPHVEAAAPPATQRAWLVRSTDASGVDPVPRWLQQSICSLPASRLPNPRPGMTREEIAALVEQTYSADSYNERNTKVEEFHNFLTRMGAGDVVTTTREQRMLLGRIAGAAAVAAGPDGLAELVRPVDWSNGNAPIDLLDLPPLVRARLRVQQDVVDLSRELPQLAPLLELADIADRTTDEDETEAEEAAERVATPQVSLPRITPGFAEELHLPERWLQDVVDELRDRRQLVLYGPPGTGKTHLALKLAQHLTPDPQNVKLVQFHPTYSYEDFFEGYRPARAVDGSVGFQLKPGPFRRLVDRARDDPTRPYVLVIDELNRANLATVFGELYFLLEYRNEAIDLVYSNDELGFTLPDNVFIIGTMNTLDRSVALFDSAMRRRFAFFSLHPAEEPIRSLLDKWLEHRGFPLRPARLLDLLNRRIDSHDLAIGPSYFMRSEINVLGDEGLARVWRTSILPLLEEQHGGERPEEIAERYDLQTLLAEVDAGA